MIDLVQTVKRLEDKGVRVHCLVLDGADLISAGLQRAKQQGKQLQN
jgi:DNA invertase Pin-like site-specific DNA recombinase